MTTYLSAVLCGELLDSADFVIMQVHEADFTGEAHQDGEAIRVHRHAERLFIKLLKLVQRAAAKEKKHDIHTVRKLSQ